MLKHFSQRIKNNDLKKETKKRANPKSRISSFFLNYELKTTN